MAVQDAEAPRGEHKHAGSRENNSDHLNCKISLDALKSRGNCIGQDGCRQNAHKDENRYDNSEKRTCNASDPLMDQGFDSLMAVELRNRLSQIIGKTLPVSLLFDYPTLEKIRDFKRSIECVGRSRVPQIMCKNSPSYKAKDPA